MSDLREAALEGKELVKADFNSNLLVQEWSLTIIKKRQISRSI